MIFACTNPRGWDRRRVRALSELPPVVPAVGIQDPRPIRLPPVVLLNYGCGLTGSGVRNGEICVPMTSPDTTISTRRLR